MSTEHKNWVITYKNITCSMFLMSSPHWVALLDGGEVSDSKNGCMQNDGQAGLAHTQWAISQLQFPHIFIEIDLELKPWLKMWKKPWESRPAAAQVQMQILPWSSRQRYYNLQIQPGESWLREKLYHERRFLVICSIELSIIVCWFGP